MLIDCTSNAGVVALGSLATAHVLTSQAALRISKHLKLLEASIGIFELPSIIVTLSGISHLGVEHVALILRRCVGGLCANVLPAHLSSQPALHLQRLERT